MIDLICFCGLALIAEGIREIYPAGVPIFIGVVLVWIAVRGAGKQRTEKK